MASFEFDFKPQNTFWYRCSTEIEFDCGTPPKSVDDADYQVVGFGFIFAHKYRIKTIVQSSTRRSCSLADCGRGICYDGVLLVRLNETAGIGFGFGKGTVAIGITTRVTRTTERFQTPCICCDVPTSETATGESTVKDNAALDVIATAVAGSSVAAANLVARAYPNLGLSPYVEWTTIGLAGLALLGVVARAFSSSSSKADDSPTSTPTHTGQVAG